MNMKEAFRYQNFLAGILGSAVQVMNQNEHRLNVVKTHKMHDANPDAQDKTETVVVPNKIDLNAVVRLMQEIAVQREKLTTAISAAKATIGFDFDAAIEANKVRQSMARMIAAVLNTKASESVEKGTGYKFNNEGVQAPYVYDIEVAKTESFDRAALTKAMADARKDSDETSAKLDVALVTTQVEYEPKWDVNMSFEDVLASMSETAA